MPPRPSRLTTAALLLGIALALRAWDFGNPVIHVDEQYYLLVGDRMLHGAMPYIDIWDRKPIGLFLLYAGIRLLPGDGILAYQIVATVFAWATALVVMRAATVIGARPRGSLAAGAIYLVWLSLLGGRGGQSPVFYNLFVAGAALLTLRLPELAAQNRLAAIIGNGIAACLLAGIAIQMKYTPAFEGAYFGLAHLWFARRAGARPIATVAGAVLWVLAGIGPTLAVIGHYAWLSPHALTAFWFANVASIFLRPPYPTGQIAMRLLGITAQLAPPILCAAIGWWRRPRGGLAGERSAIAVGWLIAGVVGFLAIGTFFDHYALPLIAPLALAASPTFGRSWRALVATLGLGLTLVIVERFYMPDDAPGARAVARIVRANSGSECPYVFIGDTITYQLADTCLPTIYAFPNLLAYNTEQGATGIDEAAEVRRILSRHPPAIVTSTRRLSIWNPASLIAVKGVLARDYRPVFSVPRANYRTVVYLRRDRAYVPP